MALNIFTSHFANILLSPSLYFFQTISGICAPDARVKSTDCSYNFSNNFSVFDIKSFVLIGLKDVPGATFIASIGADARATIICLFKLCIASTALA